MLHIILFKKTQPFSTPKEWEITAYSDYLRDCQKSPSKKPISPSDSILLSQCQSTQKAERGVSAAIPPQFNSTSLEKSSRDLSFTLRTFKIWNPQAKCSIRFPDLNSN